LQLSNHLYKFLIDFDAFSLQYLCVDNLWSETLSNGATERRFLLMGNA